MDTLTLTDIHTGFSMNLRSVTHIAVQPTVGSLSCAPRSVMDVVVHEPELPDRTMDPVLAAA